MALESQVVGAFGEKVAEAELLRRGWRTANYNTSVKNAARYDLVAWKDNRIVQLRIKTCGSMQNAFQFSCPLGRTLDVEGVSPNDYTILVRMGDENDRCDDRFYIVPTSILWAQINARRAETRKNGTSRLDFGLCTLRLRPHGGGQDRVNYGFEEKWKCFLENWPSLETDLKAPATLTTLQPTDAE